MPQERLRIDAEEMQALDKSLGWLGEFERAPVGLPGRHRREKDLKRLRAKPLDRARVDDNIRTAMRQKLLCEGRGCLQVKDRIKRERRHSIMIFPIRHGTPPFCAKPVQTLPRRHYQPLPLRLERDAPAGIFDDSLSKV